MTNLRNRKLQIQNAQHKGSNLWSKFGINNPASLNLKDIAYALGVHILEGCLQCGDAYLIRKGNKGLIRLSNSISNRGRRRFAIAHELGHWELHIMHSQIFVCTEEDMIPSYQSSTLETEANSFASGLLMPDEFFRKSMEWPPNINNLQNLADDYDTSLTATALRYVELANDYCAVISSTKGIIRWWKVSPDWEKKLWLNCGSQIPHNSYAHDLCGESEYSIKSGVTDLSTWFEVKDTDLSQEIIEESVYFPNYNQILSLIWLC